MTSFLVVDFETTGLSSSDKVVEVGWTVVNFDKAGRFKLSIPDARLINPGIAIPPETTAIHHITDEMVAGEQTDWFEAFRIGVANYVDDWPDYMVAHNAKFEMQWLTDEKNALPWICTHKTWLRLFPDCPSHSNQTLRYALPGVRNSLSPERATPPHRAAPDTYVTAYLLIEALKHESAEVLAEWTRDIARPLLITFGKHRGEKWADVPTGYLEWIVHESDMDEDTKALAAFHIEDRRSA